MLISNPQHFMLRAINQAKIAASLGEVPVGAVVVYRQEIIAEAHNLVEKETDATLHAEILAIKIASKKLNSWRLNDCSLFVTLEPCSMCMGALVLSRISEVYFGCKDPRQGACGSLFDLSNNCGLPHSFSVYPQLMEEDCSSLLQMFFKEIR
jgi:tRNA(adenine34) deaminase